MIQLEKSLSLTVLFAASMALGACTSDVESAETQTEDPGAPPALPTFSAEGVTLEKNTPDAASGRFERHDATIHFEIDRDHGKHHALITRLSGEHLFESTLENGIDASSYLGGKVTTVGPMGEEPQKEGDVHAFEELSAMPEAKVMIELKPALGSAGVSEACSR